MSNIIPPSSDSHRRAERARADQGVHTYGAVMGAYEKGIERATGARRGEAVPVTIGHLPKQAAAAVANRIEQPPVLTAPTVAVPMDEQIRGLKHLADTAHNTPRLVFTPFQTEALMKIDSKLDPTLAAMYIGILQEKSTPQEMTQALEDGLIQYMNPDGTPKQELKDALNGKGIGQYVMKDNVPDSAKAALTGGPAMQAQGKMQGGPATVAHFVRRDATTDVEGSLDSSSDTTQTQGSADAASSTSDTTPTKESGDATPPTPDPDQALNEYLTACLEKGWGAGKGLSPLFALMLLITQYNNMRSLMDEKLGMIRQQAIKAGYDAQMADMTSKAYAALSMAILTGVATAASAAIQIKGYVKKPDAAMQAEVEKLQEQKVKTDQAIASEKEAIRKNTDNIAKLEEVKKDPGSAQTSKQALDERLQKLEKLKGFDENELKKMEDIKTSQKELNELRAMKDKPQDFKDEAKLTEAEYDNGRGIQRAPSELCDPTTGMLDSTKVEAKLAEVQAKIDSRPVPPADILADGKTPLKDGKTILAEGEINPEKLQAKIDSLKENLKTNEKLKSEFPEIQDANGKIDSEKLKVAMDGIKDDQKLLVGADGKTISATEAQTKIAELKATNFQSRDELTTLQRGSDIQGQNIDAKQNAIISKQTTQVQTVNTILQGFIQFVGSISQFTSALFDIQIKGHEYQVTEDTFFQRQLGVNQQQAEQSISSVRQAYAQAEESTSGTLGGIARNIV